MLISALHVALLFYSFRLKPIAFDLLGGRVKSALNFIFITIANKLFSTGFTESISFHKNGNPCNRMQYINKAFCVHWTLCLRANN